MEYLSTTSLAKERNLDAQELFKLLKEKGWIYKKEDQWHLTKEGELAGGRMKYNPKYGEYVTWPSNLNLDQERKYGDTLNATKIGEHFSISARKVNLLFEELGWVENTDFGWKISKQGKNQGGFEMESQQGKTYIVWDESILQNKYLIKSVNAITGKDYEDANLSKVNEEINTDEYRKSHEAKYRTKDGHRVRSRAEALIDDFLYTNGIAHAYEKILPIDENAISDFYILRGNVYIEFWGMEENEAYAKRKQEKLNLYAQNNLNLIEITENDLYSLDDVLTKKLTKYKVKID